MERESLLSALLNGEGTFGPRDQFIRDLEDIGRDLVIRHDGGLVREWPKGRGTSLFELLPIRVIDLQIGNIVGDEAK